VIISCHEYVTELIAPCHGYGDDLIDPLQEIYSYRIFASERGISDSPERSLTGIYLSSATLLTSLYVSPDIPFNHA
jgi:hypothetical protein